MAIRNWKDIPLFKDVTDEQWNDWHWQVEHRLSTVEEIAQVVNLTEQEKADIEKVMGGFRVGITPYYASLMDPDDPRDPVRMQAVPTLAEMHRSEADDLDPLHEDADSPAPGLTHRYPDRVLFLITDQCSMYTAQEEDLQEKLTVQDQEKTSMHVSNTLERHLRLETYFFPVVTLSAQKTTLLNTSSAS